MSDPLKGSPNNPQSDMPVSLHDMLRRALASQVELGVGEVVVSSRRVTLPGDTPTMMARAASVVPVAQAMELETESALADCAVANSAAAHESAIATVQGSMDLMQTAEYTSLEEHREAICECQACPLGQARTKFVYGVGNPNAKLMFVGEAPGADEDRLGEPFVGRAGKLLDKILEAMQLSRNDVYIANILKCRPPGNRDPQPEEMNKCFPYLREQIRLIRPKLLCALGRISAQALLQTTTPLGKLRGSWHEYEGVPMRVTYHPAALLRFPQYKKETWIDMQEIMARLKEVD